MDMGRINALLPLAALFNQMRCTVPEATQENSSALFTEFRKVHVPSQGYLRAEHAFGALFLEEMLRRGKQLSLWSYDPSSLECCGTYTLADIAIEGCPLLVSVMTNMTIPGLDDTAPVLFKSMTLNVDYAGTPGPSAGGDGDFRSIDLSRWNTEMAAKKVYNMVFTELTR